MIHTHKREDLVLRTAQIHLVFDKNVLPTWNKERYI